MNTIYAMAHVRITNGIKLAKKVAIIVENISGILTYLNKAYLLDRYIKIDPNRAIGIAIGSIGE